ncbi:hypothetical protein [Bacillus cereus]|uniref:hypothetical protein n=1 Tax=Bacillus cereus TaxID=1396 RepID=UPI000C28E61B|nr:hypothetical protein [Bacillus cereus]
MGIYNINQLAYFENLDLEVVVTSIRTSESEAKNVGRNMDVKIILKFGYLEIRLNGKTNIINDCENKKYQFRIFTKNDNLVSSSELNVMSNKEKINLLQKEACIDTEGKFVNVDWNFSEVYELLHLKYPEMDSFVFNSFAHLIESFSHHIMNRHETQANK